MIFLSFKYSFLDELKLKEMIIDIFCSFFVTQLILSKLSLIKFKNIIQWIIKI